MTIAVPGKQAGLVLALAMAAIVAMSLRAHAAGLGENCGGATNATCDAGFWCEPEPDQCGSADASGTCARSLKFCYLLFRPVCGCDGKTYNNECERRRAKVRRDHDGACS